METRRLYYEDSHLKTFKATVLSCQTGKHGYDIILDQTAFYPEGGGQPGDRGVLGGVSVTDTHSVGDQVVHYCEGPLEEGTQVEGTIDWQWRLDLMQQHSGEHIVSGLIYETYGYHNVGFHVGKDTVTIDFDGMIDAAALAELERRANEVVWADVPVEILWPDREALSQMSYRSKKELTGAVRLVRFPGVDLCACCGTHVKRTGETGLVKFLSVQKFHEGVRIELLCGKRALDYLAAAAEQNRRISGLLSAKPMETADAVAKLQQDLAEAKYRAAQLEDKIFGLKAESLRDAGDVLLFEDGLKPDGLRRLADAVMHTCGGRCAVFSPADGGHQYAIGLEGGDLRAFGKEMNAALSGRGGGKPFFIQGSVKADRAAIEAFFRK